MIDFFKNPTVRNVVRWFFHLQPLAFLFLQFYYVFFAALALVVLAYIKCLKLKAAVDYHRDDPQMRIPFERAEKFWRYFCFGLS